MRKKLNNKAQVKIIVVILIILISIVSLAIVWNIVSSLVREKSEEIELGNFVIDLNIEEVILFETNAVHVKVSRGGGGEIEGLRFVFYDEQGNTKILDERGLDELETEVYYFSPIKDFGKIKSVSVAPIVNKKLGIESEVRVGDVFSIPSGVVRWWNFNESLSDKIKNEECKLIGDKYNCGNSSDLSFNNQIAISFWINTPASEDKIIKKGNNYVVDILDNGLIKFFYSEKEKLSDDRINLTDNNWHHVVVGSNGIYIDNELHNSYRFNNGIINNEDLIISEDVDNLMIFNKSLSLIEIQGIYSNQLR